MGDIFDQVAAHSSSNGAAPPPPAHGDIFDQVASGNVVTKSPSDYAPDLAAEAARGAARLKQRTLGSMEHRDDVPLYSSSPYLLDNPDAAKPVMVNPHQDQGFFGQPITGTQSVVDGSSQIANAHSGADLAGGASKVIRGAGSVVAPVALPLALATAPIPTLAALGTGTLAQKGTEAALDGRVAPEYRDLAGDAAGLVAGGLAGHGAGEVVDTIDTLRNLPGAGPGIPGKIADVVGSAAGSLPGSLDGVRNKAADVLNASARQNIETALNPTTKINKKLTRDQVAQGLVDRRVTATSLKHLEEKAGSKADELGQQIDDAFDAHAEAGTKLDPEPILAALQEEKESYIVDGVVIDKSYVDKIHDLQEQLKDVAKANGGEVPVASLRRIRQIHDKAIAGSKGGFALAPADASTVAALKTYADAIRGSIANADPKLAKLNQEYSFWRNAEKVAGDSADRKTGQRPALTQTVLENGGMAAGAALGGGTGAIVGRWLGKATGKLANSTLWNTLSASAKGRIADLLATGDEAGANRVARDPNNHSITPAGATATLAGGAAGTAQSAGGNGSSGPAAAPVSPGGSAVIPANSGRGAAQGGATAAALPGSGGAEADAFPGVRIAGKSAVVALPDGSGLKVRYEIRDGGTVNATHSPVTFSPNAKSRVRATQPRDYEDPLNHGVVVERATPAAYNANYSLASDAPSAADGPPIAYDQLDEGKPNGRADALAGNERHMVNLRMQKMYPEVFDRTYGAGLRERLGAYGMDPKVDLSGIQNPHVFRVVEGRLSPEEMQRVMADTNKSVTKSATASEQMISDSRRVSPATLNDLAGKVESFGPDATLAQALEGTPGGEVVQRLIDDGVIAKAERGKYIDSDGKITKEGKLRVSGLAIGRFFTDPEQLKEVQPSVRTKLERMAAPLVKVENDPDWSLTPRVSAALDLIHRARMRGMDNLGDFVKQDGLFSSEKYSPEVIHMAELLRAKGGSKELTAGARLYAEDASFAGGGASLLGDTPTPKSSFEQHFGKPADSAAPQSAKASKQAVPNPEQSKAAPESAPFYLPNHDTDAISQLGRQGEAESAAAHFFKGSGPDDNSVLFLNSKALEQVDKFFQDAGHSPWPKDQGGVAYAEYYQKKFARHLESHGDDFRAQMVQAGLTDAQAENIHSSLAQALKDSPNPTLVISDQFSQTGLQRSARHEVLHRDQFKLSSLQLTSGARDFYSHHLPPDDFADHPLFQKASKALSEMTHLYADNPEGHVSETAAWLGSGDAARLGFTDSEAIDALAFYFGKLTEFYGNAGADMIENMLSHTAPHVERAVRRQNISGISRFQKFQKIQ